LTQPDTFEAKTELLRAMDEMRRSGDNLDAGTRRRARNQIYLGLRASDEPALLAILPPDDHHLTFRWLVTGNEIAQSAELSYYDARLMEAAGNFDDAAKQYRALITQDIPRFEERVKAGLARCEQRSAGRR
jgi:hypothetical protein